MLCERTLIVGNLEIDADLGSEVDVTSGLACCMVVNSGLRVRGVPIGHEKKEPLPGLPFTFSVCGVSTRLALPAAGPCGSLPAVPRGAWRARRRASPAQIRPARA